MADGLEVEELLLTTFLPPCCLRRQRPPTKVVPDIFYPKKSFHMFGFSLEGVLLLPSRAASKMRREDKKKAIDQILVILILFMAFKLSCSPIYLLLLITARETMQWKGVIVAAKQASKRNWETNLKGNNYSNHTSK